MSEIAPGSLKVKSFPAAPEAQADEATASIIEVLQEHLALAREGKLRSIAVCPSQPTAVPSGHNGPVRTVTLPP